MIPARNYGELSGAGTLQIGTTLHNMAGTSDKARFYLENSVAELNELERKKVFTRVCSTPVFVCSPY
jgi:hypothetical protein